MPPARRTNRGGSGGAAQHQVPFSVGGMAPGGKSYSQAPYSQYGSQPPQQQPPQQQQQQPQSHHMQYGNMLSGQQPPPSMPSQQPPHPQSQNWSSNAKAPPAPSDYQGNSNPAGGPNVPPQQYGGGGAGYQQPTSPLRPPVSGGGVNVSAYNEGYYQSPMPQPISGHGPMYGLQSHLPHHQHQGSRPPSMLPQLGNGYSMPPPTHQHHQHMQGDYSSQGGHLSGGAPPPQHHHHHHHAMRGAPAYPVQCQYPMADGMRPSVPGHNMHSSQMVPPMHAHHLGNQQPPIQQHQMQQYAEVGVRVAGNQPFNGGSGVDVMVRPPHQAGPSALPQDGMGNTYMGRNGAPGFAPGGRTNGGAAPVPTPGLGPQMQPLPQPQHQHMGQTGYVDSVAHPYPTEYRDPMSVPFSAAASPLPADADAVPMMQRAMDAEASVQRPIADMYHFLVPRDLVERTQLSNFFPENYDAARDGPLKLAMDGNYCLGWLKDKLHAHDPLWFLHSSLPDELLDLLRENMESLRSVNLEPILVFNGLGISGDVEAYLMTQDELTSRSTVWKTLLNGELPDDELSRSAFDQSLGEDVHMAILRFLQKELGVMVVAAPFLNWAQMVTFVEEGVADLLFGPSEALCIPYDPMKLIIDIELTNGTPVVAFLNRDRVLRTLFPHHVTETDTRAASDRFIDFCLITASHPALSSARVALRMSIQDIYEELSTTAPHYPSICKMLGDQSSEASEPSEHGQRCRTAVCLKHAKGRNYIRYNVVFSTKQKDCPLTYLRMVLEPHITLSDIPVNLVGVFGSHVPVSLFFFHYSGLLSLSIMTVLTQTYLRDDCPVADTDEYHNILHRLMALRAQIVHQLFPRIHNEEYQKRLHELSWVRWYEPILAPFQRLKSPIELDEWDLHGSEAVMQISMDDMTSQGILHTLEISTKVNCFPLGHSSNTGEGVEKRYNGITETYLAILLKVFDFLGYFSHLIKEDQGSQDPHEVEVLSDNVNLAVSANHDYMPQGDESGQVMVPDAGESFICFSKFLTTALRANPPELHGALVLLTELLRVSILNHRMYTYAQNSPGFVEDDLGEEDEDPAVILASRIACLLPVKYKSQNPGEEFSWAPVYSRHLCAFVVMVRAMNRGLRDLVEVITASVHLDGTSDCTLQEFAALSLLLPFGTVPTAIGGLLLHYVLVFPLDYEDYRHTPEGRIAFLQEKFRNIADVGKELEKVMAFTVHSLYLVKAYVRGHTAVVSEDLREDSYVIDRALSLLSIKWEAHFDSPFPEDTICGDLPYDDSEGAFSGNAM